MVRKVLKKILKRKTKKASKPKAETDVYLLLDRSGSMGVRWDESLNAINSYVADLQKSKVTGNAILALFDESAGFKFEIARNDKIKNWKPVTSADGRARGMTPLYDAVARIVALAEKNEPNKAVIVIITDGHENASAEYTQLMAKQLLDNCRARGWSVVMLGADFENAQQAASLGTSTRHSMVMRGVTGMSAGMGSLVGSTVAYSTGATADVSFSDADRLKAANDNNKTAKSRAA